MDRSGDSPIALPPPGNKVSRRSASQRPSDRPDLVLTPCRRLLAASALHAPEKLSSLRLRDPPNARTQVQSPPLSFPQLCRPHRLLPHLHLQLQSSNRCLLP